MGRRKYRNQPVEIDGHKFDSQHEAGRYLYLRRLEEKGEILDLKLQDHFQLLPAQYVPTGETYKRGKHKGSEKYKLAERKCEYIADFTYVRKDTCEFIVEDAKGVKTKEYRIKKKLTLYVHNIQIKEV